MDNPETQETLDTRHRTKTYKTKNTTQKTKKFINTDYIENKTISHFANNSFPFP